MTNQPASADIDSIERKVFDNIVEKCIDRSRSRVLVVYDNTTVNLLEAIKESIDKSDRYYSQIEVEIGKNHGTEPKDIVAEEFLKNDIIICLTRYSMAHTMARKVAEKKGIPFLSMPDYDMEMIRNPAHLVDYTITLPEVKRYAELLTQIQHIHITSNTGTDLYIDVNGRNGNCCPGLVNSEYLLGSPPDIEANIPPIESFTHGKIVVDGSITDRRIGLLNSPVVLNVDKGNVVGINSEDKQVEATLKNIFEEVNSPLAYTIGELGIGFNDSAKLCGNMLIDEGTKGTIHFGIGSNWTIGGNNRVSFHLDFIVKQATVEADDVVLIEEGELRK